MRREIRLPVFWTLLVQLSSAGAAAQEQTPAVAAALPAYRNRILGVFDARTGEPVEGADVIDMRSGNSIKTSSTGTASLLFIPDGGGLVRIRKLGYALQTQMISISPADTTPVTWILERVTELPTVVTIDSNPHYRTPTLRGFEERRLHPASGYFIPESTLRREEARQLGQTLIAHFPNVNVTSGRGSSMFLQRSPRCGAGGPPSVWLDGALIAAERPGAPVNLSQFQNVELAGIEYYPNTATAPVQFGATSSACGALLLWTRER